MKYFFFFSKFLILIAVTACSKGSDGLFDSLEGSDVPQIELENIDSEVEINIDNYLGKTTKLSEVVEDFYFLKLDTKGEILGEVTKVIATDSMVILADRYVTKSFAGFNAYSGELLFYVNDVGDGPTQYKSIYDVEIDELNEKILVLDGAKRKIHEFNYKGKYIGNKNTSGFLSDFKYFNNTIIAEASRLINGHMNFGFESAGFLWFDSLHNLQGFTEPTNTNNYVNDYRGYDYLNRHKENISFLPPYGYTIYNYDAQGHKLTSPLSITSSGKLWDKQEARSLSFDEFAKKSLENLKYFSLGNHFISTNWVGLEIQNRKRKTIYVFSTLDGQKYHVIDAIAYDIPGLVLFGFPVSSIDDWVVTYLNPQQINALIQPEGLDKIKEANMYSSKLEMFYSGIIDPEDPVLLFYKLKK